ncbi:MAG: secondary thiamine-phosphate synthase enzyme YjbQ [Thermodesulfobacteriota bacterium]|nr:secondary thiamine-phosphate synthase enzyme YjbQ [Thermodesulfobacteriota bacterium]
MGHFHQGTLIIKTKGFTDILDITDAVVSVLEESKITSGILHAFVTGSTAGLTTIEYEDGAILDLKDAFDRIAPMDIDYSHNERWGDGNGFSHIRASLLGPSLSVPIRNGSLQLGAWQQVVLVDFDNRSRERTVVISVQGESS